MILMKRTVLLLTLCLLTILGAASCSNTMNGIGQDMERNGQAIQKQF